MIRKITIWFVVDSYHLHSAVHGDLIVPPTKTVCYIPRSFAVTGPST